MCEPSTTSGLHEYLQTVIMATILCPDQSQSTSLEPLCDSALINAFRILLKDAELLQQRSKKSQTREDPSGRYIPGFGNTLTLFAFTMTEAKLRKFKQQVSVCRCASDQSMARLHGEDLDGPTLISDNFLLNLCRSLYLLIGIMLRLPGIGNPLDPRDLGATGPLNTPDSLSEGVQLVTTKAADVITASRCWFKHTYCPFIPQFLTLWARREQKSFLPILRTNAGQDFLSMVVKKLQRLTTDIQKKPSIVGKPSAEGQILEDVIMAYVHFIREVMFHFRIQFQRTNRPLLDAIHNAAVALVDAFEALKPADQKLFLEENIISVAVYIGMGTIPGNASDQTTHAKMNKLVLYYTKYNEVGGRAVKAAVKMLDGWRPDRDLYFRVWWDLMTILPVKECLNPRCGKLPKYHRFAKCAQCQIVTYCSQQCQKQAWTLPECPHRKVCKDWGRLVECWPKLLGVEDDSDMNAKERNKQLKNLVAHLDISETTLTEISQNIGALQRIRKERDGDAGPGGQFLVDTLIPPILPKVRV